MPLEIGLLLFPKLTQLDLTGPYEVFAKFPDAKVRLIWKSTGPVTADGGMAIIADTNFANCPPLDIICIPGGPGISALLDDAETLAFVRRQAATAKHVTSVCTGALVLGATGLLFGKRATTHWMSHAMLAEFGAIPTQARVVRDGNILTGGGVTAGIDMALTLATEIMGPRAMALELLLEYDPVPPHGTGTPEKAAPAIVEGIRRATAEMQVERLAAVRRAAARLASGRT